MKTQPINTHKMTQQEQTIQELEIKGEKIKLKTKISPRSRNIYLKIEQNDTLLLTIPKGKTIRNGMEFLEEKADWILKHMSRMREHQNIYSKARIKSGSLINFLGEKTIVLETKAITGDDFYWKLERSEIPFTLDRLLVFIPKQVFENECFLLLALKDFYKKAAYEYLLARVTHYSKLIKQPFRKIRVKDLSTRWGSCSSLRNLNFNYRIMLAPREVVEYLVVHEVAHLQYMNHSQYFWNLVEKLQPDYKKHLHWLKAYGHELQIIV
jgi:predicted metal-dependent hydrolase